MRVEIYDQYKTIYLDNTDNKLKFVRTERGESVDTSRYTLVHEGIGSTVVVESNLTLEEAKNLVTDLYVESQSLGESYDDKLLKLNDGYAELVISFSDGRVLNRVIQVI